MYCNDMMNECECEYLVPWRWGNEDGHADDHYDPDYHDDIEECCEYIEQWEDGEYECEPCMPRILRVYFNMDVDPNMAGAHINYIENNSVIHDGPTMKKNIEKLMSLVKTTTKEYFEVEDENYDTHELHKKFVLKWLDYVHTEIMERIADAWERGVCEAEFGRDLDRDPYPWEV